MNCHGNAPDTCCIFEGVVCPHLRTNVAGRRWACSLMLEHNDWNKVISDPRYIEDVAPKFQRLNKIYGLDLSCKNWPPPGATCGCS